jgi:hypothetical protein
MRQYAIRCPDYIDCTILSQPSLCTACVSFYIGLGFQDVAATGAAFGAAAFSAFVSLAGAAAFAPSFAPRAGVASVFLGCSGTREDEAGSP